MLIDTHAHLNFKAFDKDGQKIARECLSQDLWLVNASSNLATSKKAVDLAQQFDKGIYAAVGLHPIHILDEDFRYQSYKKLAQSNKVVAIGETGLDYWNLPPDQKEQKELKQKQKQVMLQHIRLANGLSLPLILHCRKAHQELINFLTNLAHARLIRKGGMWGVVHCFTGNATQLQQYLNMGLYIGFNGIIFKLELDNIIKKTPLERILIETDSPFLTPPQSPEKRNTPLSVKYLAQRIAEIKKQPLKKVANQTTQNAKDLFQIPRN